MNEMLFRSLYRIRRVEEEVARIYPSDKIKSPIHLSIGQEAASVGVCEALRPDDRVLGTCRGHALYMAKGGDLKEMVAELYGKVTGCCKGKGGSMHLAHFPSGMMGTSAVVGTTIPVALGVAYSLKLQGNGNIAAVFFGDGAAEEGVFHETLNFARLRNLPILFVCENNFYSIHSPLLTRQSSLSISDRLPGYDIPAVHIEDGDVHKIVEASRQLTDDIRGGGGPRFLEICAYRWMEHVGPDEDFDAGYRSKEEAQIWLDRDPVKCMGDELAPSVRAVIEEEVEREIKEAFDFAEESAFPPDSSLYTHVYKEA